MLVRLHFADGPGSLVELPAQQAAVQLPPTWGRGRIGIVVEILLYSHQRVLEGLVLHIVFPGLLRGNLEDHMRRRSCFVHLPASQMAERYPFDDSNIWCQRILFRVLCSIEVEVFI